MCLCREVRFSAILLSCIVVPLGGIGASRTEAAVGLSACTWPTTCSFLYFPSDAPQGVVSLVTPESWPQGGLPNDGSPAMAIPEGPGAVCLGVMGFFCVALVKNRRIWIGLCLFVLGNGRIGAARMSRLVAPEPEHGTAGSSNKIAFFPSLAREASSCLDREGLDAGSAKGLSFPDFLGCPHILRSGSFGWFREDHIVAGLLSQADIGLGAARRGRPTCILASIVQWPVFDGEIQRARPPPARFSPRIFG